ncbi:hypothetical protein ATY75_29070 [Rhizobium sp. N122]|uniref:hypothetical protein n=1 Tax=Rhizobium sp. N122 TaxID=1764272 RepID=UPI000B5A2A4C|nr:hypothetical protein [Rhizobium sp. N122]OWV78064.1 hypothetical protein ATY75_29070 [Rhizobium sp. N122]
MRHEMRPSIDEMLDAASLGTRCHVISSKIAGRWTITGRHEPSFKFSGLDVRLGDLLSRGGKLVSHCETAELHGIEKINAAIRKLQEIAA